MGIENWEESWVKYRRYIKGPDIKAFGMNRNSRILDLGCGCGYDLKRFIELGYNNVVGIDILESLVNECRKQGFNVKVGDMRNIPFDDKAFDYVFAHGVFHHLDDVSYHKQVFKEINRVLKKDGVLCVIDIKRTFLRKIADFITNYFPVIEPLRLRKQAILKEEKHLVKYWFENYDTIMGLLNSQFKVKLVKNGFFFMYLKCQKP